MPSLLALLMICTIRISGSDPNTLVHIAQEALNKISQQGTELGPILALQDYCHSLSQEIQIP